MQLKMIAEKRASGKMYGTLMEFQIFFFFVGFLLHQKILTAENLRKKGIEGPSRCIMCKKAEEKQKHLFLDCSFANEVWCSTIKEINFNFIC